MSGVLVAIGGNEDKESNKTILRHVVRLAEAETVEVIPTASSIPDEVARDYEQAFKDLKVKDVGVLDIRRREEADSEERAQRVADADVLFFTGGDQLRLTTLLGGTLVGQAVQRRYRDGGLIAGTSAGAAAMSSTMIFEGDPTSSMRKGNVQMMPGLGLVDSLVFDTHFIDRGRLGRLLEVVVSNPGFIGIGLSEDTAVVLDRHSVVETIGQGVAVLVDGHGCGYSNISEIGLHDPIAVEGLTVHTLVDGHRYDLRARRYLAPEGS